MARQADLGGLDVVEHKESDSVDVWLTVDPRRDSTEGSCWEYSTHPAPCLCMQSVRPDAQHRLAFGSSELP